MRSRHVPKTADPHLMERIRRDREQREARAKEQAELAQDEREAHERARARGIRLSIELPMIEAPEEAPPAEPAVKARKKTATKPQRKREPSRDQKALLKDMRRVCGPRFRELGVPVLRRRVVEDVKAQGGDPTSVPHESTFRRALGLKD